MNGNSIDAPITRQIMSVRPELPLTAHPAALSKKSGDRPFPPLKQSISKRSGEKGRNKRCPPSAHRKVSQPWLCATYIPYNNHLPYTEKHNTQVPTYIHETVYGAASIVVRSATRAAKTAPQVHCDIPIAASNSEIALDNLCHRNPEMQAPSLKNSNGLVLV